MESMSLERIHSMLRMMAAASSSGGGGESWTFDMNLLQLKRFLQSRIDSDVLEVTNDACYKLRK